MGTRTMSKETTDWKTNAKKIRVRSLACTTLLQIFEIYDDQSIAMHLVNILRSRGAIEGRNPDGSPRFRDPYYLKDEDILKIMENYREELDVTALESLQLDDND